MARKASLFTAIAYLFFPVCPYLMEIAMNAGAYNHTLAPFPLSGPTFLFDLSLWREVYFFLFWVYRRLSVLPIDFETVFIVAKT